MLSTTGRDPDEPALSTVTRAVSARPRPALAHGTAALAAAGGRCKLLHVGGSRYHTMLPRFLVILPGIDRPGSGSLLAAAREGSGRVPLAGPGACLAVRLAAALDLTLAPPLGSGEAATGSPCVGVGVATAHSAVGEVAGPIPPLRGRADLPRCGSPAGRSAPPGTARGAPPRPGGA